MPTRRKVENSVRRALKDQWHFFELTKQSLEQGWSFPVAVAQAKLSYHVATQFCDKFEHWRNLRDQHKQAKISVYSNLPGLS